MKTTKSNLIEAQYNCNDEKKSNNEVIISPYLRFGNTNAHHR